MGLDETYPVSLGYDPAARQCVCFIGRLFNSDNFARSATLAEACALLSDVLVTVCIMNCL